MTYMYGYMDMYLVFLYYANTYMCTKVKLVIRNLILYTNFTILGVR